MENLNTNDLLCCRFCFVSRLILNAWKILAFCGRILAQLCINFGKSDGSVIDQCCLRHCYRGCASTWEHGGGRQLPRSGIIDMTKDSRWKRQELVAHRVKNTYGYCIYVLHVLVCNYVRNIKN